MKLLGSPCCTRQIGFELKGVEYKDGFTFQVISDGVGSNGTTTDQQTRRNQYELSFQFTKRPEEITVQELKQQQPWIDAYLPLFFMSDGAKMEGGKADLIKIREYRIGNYKGVEFITQTPKNGGTEPVFARSVLLIDDQYNTIRVDGSPDPSFLRVFRKFVNSIQSVSPSSPGTPAPTSRCDLGSSPPDTMIYPSPSPVGAVTIENNGTVCFTPISDHRLKIVVETSNTACLPVGCTLVSERTGNITIDQDTKTIQLNTRFVAKDLGERPVEGISCGCFSDCQGAGRLEFDTGLLEEGIYTIMFGKQSLGQIYVPLISSNLCSQPGNPLVPQIPPTPVPTRDYTNYPPPAEPSPIPSSQSYP